jgi:hypothetical protein
MTKETRALQSAPPHPGIAITQKRGGGSNWRALTLMHRQYFAIYVETRATAGNTVRWSLFRVMEGIYVPKGEVTRASVGKAW